MIIFIDDRPLTIISTEKLKKRDFGQFDHVVDLRLEKLANVRLEGHVLLLNATPSIGAMAIGLLERNSSPDLQGITLACNDKLAVEKRIKGMFSVLKAAGGVVVKDDQWLMIYRRKLWDLPKGKLDKGEKSELASIREVEEETGVKAKIVDKICTTWHTYTHNNSAILKRTKWYLMACVDDAQMAPQVEEDIESMEWVNSQQAQRMLVNSFSSIRYVINCYKNKVEALAKEPKLTK